MGRDASADDASVDAQLDRAPSLALFKGLALAMGDAVVVNSGVIDDHIDGYRDGVFVAIRPDKVEARIGNGGWAPRCIFYKGLGWALRSIPGRGCTWWHFLSCT